MKSALYYELLIYFVGLAFLNISYVFNNRSSVSVTGTTEKIRSGDNNQWLVSTFFVTFIIFLSTFCLTIGIEIVNRQVIYTFMLFSPFTIHIFSSILVLLAHEDYEPEKNDFFFRNKFVVKTVEIKEQTAKWKIEEKNIKLKLKEEMKYTT